MQADRLKKALSFLREKGVEHTGSYQKMGNKLGYNPNYISDLVNGRFEISEKFAERFQEIFAVNKTWLLKGEGEMILAQSAYPTNTSSFRISDVSYAAQYLQSEETNAKLLKEYGDIIQTLQQRISQLMEQQISLTRENMDLKGKLSELKNPQADK